MTPNLFWRTRQSARIFPGAERFYLLRGPALPQAHKPRKHDSLGEWDYNVRPLGVAQRFVVEEMHDEGDKFGTDDVSRAESAAASGIVRGAGSSKFAGGACLGRAGKRRVGDQCGGVFARPDLARSAQLPPRRAVSARSGQQAGV